MTLTLQANAKINLGLRIVGRRKDGYHRLHTLFQEIDFADEVTLEEAPFGGVTLEVTGPYAKDIPADETNLCLQAAGLLEEQAGIHDGVQIHLKKHIPPGAGLGGGSSDAATVLRGLNLLWKRGRRWDQLEQLAGQLGADVPFFVRGGLQLGEGIGELLTPLAARLPHHVVLVMPPFGVNTAWAYGQFAARKIFPEPPAFDQLIMQDPIPWEAFTNDFEAVVFPRHPELGAIKAALLAAGAVWAGLSGSGSTVAGLFDSPPNIRNLDQQFPDCHVVLANMIGGAEHNLDST